jgi:hypothetical protein
MNLKDVLDNGQNFIGKTVEVNGILRVKSSVSNKWELLVDFEVNPDDKQNSIWVNTGDYVADIQSYYDTLLEENQDSYVLSTSAKFYLSTTPATVTNTTLSKEDMKDIRYYDRVTIKGRFDTASLDEYLYQIKDIEAISLYRKHVTYLVNTVTPEISTLNLSSHWDTVDQVLSNLGLFNNRQIQITGIFCLDNLVNAGYIVHDDETIGQAKSAIFVHPSVKNYVFSTFAPMVPGGLYTKKNVYAIGKIYELETEALFPFNFIPKLMVFQHNYALIKMDFDLT